MIRSVFLASGSALPKKCVTNDELARSVDTSDEWIVERTGIKQRYIAGEGETTSSLAIEAAQNALKKAGLSGKDIDLIVLATATPDQTFPATATQVQDALGANGGIAFDVAAVCSGFLYALGTADSMLRTGLATRALVIGAETFSRILDWEDRGTCVLFGDGAGAIILEARDTDQGAAEGAVQGADEGAAEGVAAGVDQGSAQDNSALEASEHTASDVGILAMQLCADGAHNELLYVDGGPSTTGTVGKLRMKGPEVFRHAVVNLSSVMQSVMEQAGVEAQDIDWVVPHQANARILDATARKLGLPKEKVIVTVDRHANTSAASVPLALDVAIADGRIKPGDLVVLEAMGGGFTWGASLIRL